LSLMISRVLSKNEFIPLEAGRGQRAMHNVNLVIFSTLFHNIFFKLLLKP
jgi:hypothetical protein